MKIEKANKDGIGYVTVTEEEYQASLAKGIDPETLLKPGRHKFIRGGFKRMHPDYRPETAKVKISIYLDQDILSYFRARAAQPNAAAYQTQINNVLRQAMEQDKQASASAGTVNNVISLLDDPRFTELLDRRIATQLAKQKRKRKAA
jgi:uncharacterized protein (DUF4415 family)